MTTPEGTPVNSNLKIEHHLREVDLPTEIKIPQPESPFAEQTLSRTDRIRQIFSTFLDKFGVSVIYDPMNKI